MKMGIWKKKKEVKAALYNGKRGQGRDQREEKSIPN